MEIIMARLSSQMVIIVPSFLIKNIYSGQWGKIVLEESITKHQKCQIALTETYCSPIH